MNEHADGSDLPELTDEDVEILYAICKRAGASLQPPFKALFAAYDDIFAEQQIEQQHDGVVFRYLMRVGEGTRAANRARRPVDLVEQLREVLEAHGVTFVEPTDESVEEITEPISRPSVVQDQVFRSPKRRVSFDDARLEETWLSEHSESINPDARLEQRRLLSLPPRRATEGLAPAQRPRSTSPRRDLPIRSAPLKHPYDSAYAISEADDEFNPTLLFEPSQTQLEDNADAFLATSALRSSRQTLHHWRNAVLQIQKARAHADSIAASHDRRTLLRQALDQWRHSLDEKRQDQRKFRHLKHLEEKATRCRNLFLLTKAFTHWATSCQHEQLQTKVAQRYVLKVTYFKKWRAIASENQMKVRRILARKYLAVWREKTARRLLWQEQAIAHYEENLMRKCKTSWFWHFCSRRVQGWHEQWVQRRALGQLRRCLENRQLRDRQAEDVYDSQVSRRSILALSEQFQGKRQRLALAQQHHDSAVLTRSINSLQRQAKLAPIARTLTATTDLNLKRKAFKVWELHFSLHRQATEVDRLRILQTAWTGWNDALRCKALAQKIDERVLVENLYRWVLQERLKLFQRTTDARVLNRALSWWHHKVEQGQDRLAEAEIVFAERQRRRRLALGMRGLNIALCDREDAERAAVEFRNSRALPQILGTWKEKIDHVNLLAKWASDARFYCLCSSTLKNWQERATENKHQRRRSAYAQVRARIKIRLVGGCFTRWRAKAADVRSKESEAERRLQLRVSETGTRTFHHWREKTTQHIELDVQARGVDRVKLLGSALSAVTVRYVDLTGMGRQAIAFRQETELALLAGALRRIQWATFTVARKMESAEALWARNRDQHIRQMLRHWVGQVSAKRAAARDDNRGIVAEEPESPSLRPASRAASRSADLTLPSSPPQLNPVSSTPGYLRTPSRARRAGRFKPLPTLAPFTPMAFDSTYLATTPAPLYNPQMVGIDESFMGLTPQVTPFERKLRAGGFAGAPPSALKNAALKKVQNNEVGGTNKSVRFGGASRFRNRSDDSHGRSS